jgi:hypothetical protein
MTDIFDQCDAILTELSLFSDELLYMGTAICDDRLELLEKQTGFLLPFDFKYIVKKHNGISLDGNEIYGIDKELRGTSLDELYMFEHFEVGNKMPVEFFPFSPDGYGNHYCLNLSNLNLGQCPVVFWQHDYIYENKDEVEECNASFVEWIKEVLINWTLENYNYDGTSK